MWIKQTTKDKKMVQQIFTFKVFITPKCYRTIEITGNQSLYDFAAEIVAAFNFEFDHMFGFYEQYGYGKISEGEAYELSVDMPDGKAMIDGAKSVHKTYLSKVFAPDKTMYFLFDYGDDWWFKIDCQKVEDAQIKKVYAKVIEKKGKAPVQYPE